MHDKSKQAQTHFWPVDRKIITDVHHAHTALSEWHKKYYEYDTAYLLAPILDENPGYKNLISTIGDQVRKARASLKSDGRDDVPEPLDGQSPASLLEWYEYLNEIKKDYPYETDNR